MKTRIQEGNNVLELKDTIDIMEEDDKIIITKSIKKKVSLKDLFDKYDGPNLSKEFVWDEPRGREIIR